MSYFFYKILHLFAVILLFTSLGTLAAAGSGAAGRLRRLAGVAHGVAMAIILVAGFGLLARLGLFGSIPGWASNPFTSFRTTTSSSSGERRWQDRPKSGNGIYARTNSL